MTNQISGMNTIHAKLLFFVGSGATIQGIIHGVYWGLGMAVGGVLGGLMIHEIGARLTFRLEAASCFVILVFFIAVNNFHENRRRYSMIPPEEQETENEIEEGDGSMNTK